MNPYTRSCLCADRLSITMVSFSIIAKQFLKEFNERTMLETFIKKLIVLKAPLPAYGSNYCSKFSTHSFAWSDDILNSRAPRVGEVGVLCEKNLVDKHELSFLSNRCLHPASHFLFHGLVSTISTVYRHLSHTNDFLLD